MTSGAERSGRGWRTVRNAETEKPFLNSKAYNDGNWLRKRRAVKLLGHKGLTDNNDVATQHTWKGGGFTMEQKTT